MDRFIPREKLSKKARQELNKAKRKDWNGIRPATKKIESKKHYQRKKTSVLIDTDYTEIFLLNASIA
jgi:hypothetical protein